MDLFAARGETVSFQVVVRAPAGGLTNVNVIAPDMGGPELTMYRQHYVYVRGTSDWATNRNRPGGAGWYPDPLIPFTHPETGEPLSGASLTAAPFDVTADRNQPIWVDVRVPRELAPGPYAGVFTVTSDQGEDEVSLNLTVWSFALPEQPMASSLVLYWDSSTRRDLASIRELLRHRLQPSSARPEDERGLIDDYGMSVGNLGFWSGADHTTCSMSPAPSVQEIRSAVAARQPDLRLYNYTADEINSCTNLHDRIKEWARNLHAAGVDQLITMTPTPALYDDGSGTGRSAVDIWVLLPKMFDAAVSRVAHVLDKGDQVWSYNCLQQDDYSPKWLLDYAPIDFRIQPGFINQSLGMSGILYWRADRWSSDPWNNVEGYSPSYPGEGMLVYPGEQVGVPGVVASMRLKWLRDGMNDYDYIEMLKHAGLEDWALSIARSVGPDWSEWTRSPMELEAARIQLGERLNELFGADHTIGVTATADPTRVLSGRTVALTAEAEDSEGHDIVWWHWSDGGAGGRFSPSAKTQNPSYTAPVNSGETDKDVRLTVTAGCGSAVGSASVTVAVRPGSAGFDDVSSDHWAYREIMACADAGIVAGFPDGNYYPRWVMTRAQMAVYITRALAGSDTSIPPLESQDPVFPDVPASYWAARHIKYAVDQNIVAGYGDGLFRPEFFLTRGQMAVFIARGIVEPTGEEGLAPYVPPAVPTFTDVPTHSWCYREVEYIASRDVVSGYEDGSYRPFANCTRDQMAVYVARAFELLD